MALTRIRFVGKRLPYLWSVCQSQQIIHPRLFVLSSASEHFHTGPLRLLMSMHSYREEILYAKSNSQPFVSEFDSDTNDAKEMGGVDKDFKHLTEDEWKMRLTDDEFYVCRQRGTEPPFSGSLEEGKGVYVCVCCQNKLFSSENKYESGCGWPAFHTSIKTDSTSHVKRNIDKSHGMTRTEVTCAKCGSHLGHVFPDGPQPTGERYCINSVCLKLDKTGQN